MAQPAPFVGLKFDPDYEHYAVTADHRGHKISLYLLAEDDSSLQHLLPLVKRFWTSRTSHFKAFREYCAVDLLQQLNDTNDCGQDDFKPATAAQIRKLLPVPFSVRFDFNDDLDDFYFEMSGGDDTEILGECMAPTDEAESLAAALLAGKAVPETEPRDAAHIALSAVQGMAYLVTWNFKHILNPHTQHRIDSICRDAGYIPATICTPEQLLESYDDF